MDLSIIVPVKNGARTVGRALSSLKSIASIDYEIIVIDNMSTDSTIEVVKAWREENAIELSITKCKRKGAPAARNEGLILAKGKWIQFLDADDELNGHVVSDRIARAERFGLDVLIGSFEFANNSGVKVGLLRDITPSHLIGEGIGCTCSNLYLKKLLTDIGGWNETLTSSQEADLLFRSFNNNASIDTFNQSCCIVYTDGDNRISNSSAKSRLKNFSKVRCRFVCTSPERSFRMEIALYRSILNFKAPFFERLQSVLISFVKIRSR